MKTTRSCRSLTITFFCKPEKLSKTSNLGSRVKCFICTIRSQLMVALICQDIRSLSKVSTSVQNRLPLYKLHLRIPKITAKLEKLVNSHAKEGNNGKVPWSLSQPDSKPPSFMFWVNLIMLATIDIIIQWFAFHSDLWHHWSLFTKQCWPYFQKLSLASIVSKHLLYFLPAIIIITIYLP